MYDFTASWCKPCKAMDERFWPKPEIVELSKQFVAVKVNFDKDKSFASKYGVNAIPNVVFTDPWGRGLTYQRGFSSGTEAEILEKIKFLPKDFTSLKEAGNLLESDEKNLDALHRFAAFYQQRKFYWQATEFYKKIMKLEADPAKRENTLVNLAFNHIRLDESGEAIEKFEILLKEYSKSPQSDLFIYGTLFANIKKNKLQNAEKLLSDLKTRYPESKLIPQAEQNLAEAKSKKK